MYYLGIDGGGTKTVFALADERSNILRRVTLGPTNPVDIGIEAALSTLGEGISQAVQGMNPCEVSVFAGIAGGITGDNQTRIRAFLDTLGLQVRTTEATHRISFPQGSAVRMVSVPLWARAR